MDVNELADALKNAEKNPVSALNEMRSKCGFGLVFEINVLNPCTADEQREVTYTATYSDRRQIKGYGVAKTKREASCKSALDLLCKMGVTIDELNRKKQKLNNIAEASVVDAGTGTGEESATYFQALAAYKNTKTGNKGEGVTGGSIVPTGTTKSEPPSDALETQIEEPSSTSTCAQINTEVENVGAKCEKTSLALLNEFCTQNKIKFHESSSGFTPTKPFHQVTLSAVFDGVSYEESGEARKKQDAKQIAADKLLRAMNIITSNKNENQVSSGVSDASETLASSPNPSSTTICAETGDLKRETETVCSFVSEENGPDQGRSVVNVNLLNERSSLPLAAELNNSIKKLLEMCGKKGVGQPKFELIKEEGPAHRKMYHMECRINTTRSDDLVTVAFDKQSRVARKKAAMQMIDILSNVEENSRQIVQETLSHPSVEKFVRQTGSEFVDCTNSKCTSLLSHDRHSFKKFSGSSLDILRAYNASKSSEAMEILTQISHNENFEVKYLDGLLPISDDEWQCCCYFNSRVGESAEMLPCGFIGRGETKEAARLNAAVKTLEDLRVLTGTDDEELFTCG